MRANAGGFRYDAASTDEGATFGTDASNGLIDPGCNADEISYLEPADVSSTTGAPPTTADALFSNSMNSSSRVDLTVRYSTDDGATWPYAALLVPGTAGYSTMGVLGDGTVADLYEVGDTGGIFVDHFTLAWLEAA
jgi:sialidase-1